MESKIKASDDCDNLIRTIISLGSRETKVKPIMKESSIKVNEIRVGNRIKIDGVIVTVDERTIFDFNHDGRIKEPIELTEQVLLKCGFEKQQLDRQTYFELKVNNTRFITDDNGKVRIGVQGFSQHEYLLLELEYLHQLQNVYYYLTGKELEFKA